MELVVSSILQNNIPHHEILVVGDVQHVWDSEVGRSVVHVVHNEDWEMQNWITRKKNFVFEQAQFEVVVILKDYLALTPRWYQAFKAFGTDWDVQMHQISTTSGERFLDWMHRHGDGSGAEPRAALPPRPAYFKRPQLADHANLFQGFPQLECAVRRLRAPPVRAKRMQGGILVTTGCRIVR